MSGSHPKTYFTCHTPHNPISISLSQKPLRLDTAAAQIGQYPQGVLFIPLTGLESVDSIALAVSEALDISFYDRINPQQQILDILRTKSLLLILDSFESLMAATDWVGEVLQVSPGVKVLTTSRVKLNLQAENLFPIGGMDYPVDVPIFSSDQGVDPEAITQYSAVQLFIQSARRLRPAFTPTAGGFQYIIKICQLVQGMPLAILLAANWVEMLSLPEIVAEIEKSLDFLEVDLRDIPARQRSLRAVFNQSWRLLSEGERRVFQELSIFRSGFTRDAASQIVGSALLDLKALLNKSLLQYLPTGRYEMHETLRQFAADKLNGSPSAYQAVHERHAAYYAAYIQQRESDLKGAQPQTILVEIETERGNARLAWHWAVEQRQLERMDQMMEPLCFYYLCCLRFGDGDAVCRQAVEGLKQSVTGDGVRVLAKILMWQAVFNRRLGFTGKSRDLLEHSLTLLEDLALVNTDTRLEKAAILLQMGHTLFDHSRSTAMDLYERSLALYRALDNRWGMANALSAMSWSTWSGGAYQEAKEMFQETLEIRRSLGDIRGIVDSYSGLGNVEIFLGQFDEAERLLSESKLVLQEILGVPASSDDSETPGDDPSGLEGLPLTISWYQKTVGLYSDLGFSHSLAPSNSILGFTLKHLRRYEQARNQAEEGLALARQVGWRQEEGLALEVLGEIALAEGAYDTARDYLQESLGILRSTGQLEQSEVYAVLGFAYLGLNQIPSAVRHLVEALESAPQIPTIFPIISALPGIALLLADQGQVMEAVELYALASRYPRVANSRWFEDIAGHRIADLARTLPPEEAAAAKVRGQRLDLEETAAKYLAALRAMNNSA